MKIEKTDIGKNRVFGNWVYFLKNGGGIHGKFKNWKEGDPEREPAFAHVFREEVKPGMVVLDVGANLGYYSLVAAQLMKSKGRVYAFEPDPYNSYLLNRSIDLNKYKTSIEVHDIALSDEAGEVTFYLSKASNLSSVIKTEHSDEEVIVSCGTLNKFAADKRLAQRKSGIFLRMDIEGYEVEMLRGAMTFLQKPFPCKIFMEVHPQFYSEDHSLEKELKKLLTFGFKTKYVISAAVGKPDLFDQAHYEPGKIFDCGRFSRGLYSGISDKDMLRFACHQHRQDFDYETRSHSGEDYSMKIVRSILLERGEANEGQSKKSKGRRRGKGTGRKTTVRKRKQ